jgi:hypothetical protein
MPTITATLLRNKIFFERTNAGKSFAKISDFFSELYENVTKLNNHLDKIFRIQSSKSDSNHVSSNKFQELLGEEFDQKVTNVESIVTPENLPQDVSFIRLKANYLKHIHQARSLLNIGLQKDEAQALKKKSEKFEDQFKDLHLKHFVKEEPLLANSKKEILKWLDNYDVEAESLNDFKKTLGKKIKELSIFNSSGHRFGYDLTNLIFQNFHKESISELLKDINSSDALNLEEQAKLKRYFTSFSREKEDTTLIMKKFIQELSKKYGFSESENENLILFRLYSPDLVKKLEKAFETSEANNSIEEILSSIEYSKPLSSEKIQNIFNNESFRKFTESIFAPWLEPLKKDLLIHISPPLDDSLEKLKEDIISQPNFDFLGNSRKSTEYGMNMSFMSGLQNFFREVIANTSTAKFKTEKSTSKLFTEIIEKLASDLNLSEDEQKQVDEIKYNYSWYYNFENIDLAQSRKSNKTASGEDNLKFLTDLIFRSHFEKAKKDFFKDLDSFSKDPARDMKKEIPIEEIKGYFEDFNKVPSLRQRKLNKLNHSLKSFLDWKISILSKDKRRTPTYFQKYLGGIDGILTLDKPLSDYGGLKESILLKKIYLPNLVNTIEKISNSLPPEEQKVFLGKLLQGYRFLKSPFSSLPSFHLGTSLKSYKETKEYTKALREVIKEELFPWHAELEANILNLKLKNGETTTSKDALRALKSIYPYVDPKEFNALVRENNEANYIDDLGLIKTLCTEKLAAYRTGNGKDPDSILNFYNQECRIFTESNNSLPRIDNLSKLYPNPISDHEILRDIFSLEALDFNESKEVVKKSLEDFENYAPRTYAAVLDGFVNANPRIELTNSQFKEIYSRFFYEKYQSQLTQAFQNHIETEENVDLKEVFQKLKSENNLTELDLIRNNLPFKNLSDEEFILQSLGLISPVIKECSKNELNQYIESDGEAPRSFSQFYNQIQKANSEILPNIDKLSEKDKSIFLRTVFSGEDSERKILTEELLNNLHTQSEMVQIIVLRALCSSNEEMAKLLTKKQVTKTKIPLEVENLKLNPEITSQDLKGLIKELNENEKDLNTEARLYGLSKEDFEINQEFFKDFESNVVDKFIKLPDYLISLKVNNYWKDIQENPNLISSIQEEANTAGSLAQKAHAAFLQEYQAVQDYQVPSNFSQTIEPNTMQKLTGNPPIY